MMISLKQQVDKRMKYFLYIIVVLFFSSCSLFDKEQLEKDKDGSIIGMEPLWVKELTDKPNGHGAGISGSVAIDGNSLITRHFNEKDELVWLEAETGKEKWVFKDLVRHNNDFIPTDIFIDETNLTIGLVHFFQLDIENGLPNFYFSNNEELDGGVFNGVTKLEDSYYAWKNFVERADGLLSSFIYALNDETKEIRFLLEPQYPQKNEVSSSSGLVGAIRNVNAYRLNGKDFLVLAINDYGSGKSDNYLAIYNLSESKWEFEAIPVSLNSDSNAGTSLEVYKGKAYLNSERQIHCYDLLTGELVWEQNFEGNFQFSGFAIGDSMLVGNCNEANTYGVDPDTGEIMWKVESGGTTSPIAFMNGVAYFSGGSDGRLNAIDVATGRYIWKLKRPGSSNWKRHVAVVPGDDSRPDLIVASTYKEYMAFPAAR